MKIHSICLVKDEADIVGDVILDAREWSDYIYIFDNGSTDGTTKILKQIAEKHSNVICYKWSDEPFKETLRREVYHAFKQNSSKGDWWCRLDSDEFYVDDPCTFLAAVGNKYNAVSHSSYNYYFTEKDLQSYNKQPDKFSYKDLKYYKNNFSEIRFIKDNGHLYWPPSGSWPLINMNIYPKKIRVRHYQYRDPEQIKKRAKNRDMAYSDFDEYEKRNIGYLDPSSVISKEDYLISHEALDYDNGDDTLVAHDNIPEWRPDDRPLKKTKIFIKNGLFRLNLLKYIYKALGKSE